MGTLVLLQGVLHGMLHQAQCEIVARKLSVDISAEYSDCIVVGVSAELPDGLYLAVFEGHSMRIVRDHGIWLAASPAKREPA
jgi:hypothetical protein